LPLVARTLVLGRLIDSGLKLEAVGLDAGYLTMPICHGLEKREIMGVIAHRPFSPKKGVFPKWKFTYHIESDTYTCPNAETLTYSTTNREGYDNITLTLILVRAVPYFLNVLLLKTIKRSLLDMFGSAVKKKSEKIGFLQKGKSSTKGEKKQ
jgi:hypothetical protein